MSAKARLSCVVPGCRRTRGQRKGEPTIDPAWEWLCAKHWPLVPSPLRRIMGRAQRSGRERLAALTWRKAKRIAIERAAGI